jgi:hypothetical protein
MKVCEKLTVKDGWVNGFTHHRNGNHGGRLTTLGVAAFHAPRSCGGQ